MITNFDINRFEIQSNIGKCSGIDDHFDICRVFEISKFDIARLTCIYIYKPRRHKIQGVSNQVMIKQACSATKTS